MSLFVSKFMGLINFDSNELLFEWCLKVQLCAFWIIFGQSKKWSDPSKVQNEKIQVSVKLKS